MSVFTRKCEQIVAFYLAAKAAGLLERMNPEQAARVGGLVDAYGRFTAPDAAIRNYRLALAPFMETFDHTRQLLKALYALFEAWASLGGNTVAVQAETGAWLVGADPEEDVGRLEARLPVFVKHFGAAGLPPALRVEAVRKQVADHRKAAREMPAMPPGRKRSELEADQRHLDVEGTAVWNLFHDFLDGYFGKSGDEAFSKKAEFAYDRRTLRKSRKAAPRDAGESQAKTDERAPAVPAGPVAPLLPGQVAAGTAGQLPASAPVSAPAPAPVASGEGQPSGDRK